MKLIIQQGPIAIDNIITRFAKPDSDAADICFDITDEVGNVKGKIKKVLFMGGQEYCAYDNAGNMMVKVIRSKRSMPPTCEVWNCNGVNGSLTRLMKFGSFEYEADFGGYSIEGDAFGRNYNVMQNGNLVIKIGMDTPNLTKRYILDILGNIDEVTALTLAIAIDGAN